MAKKKYTRVIFVNVADGAVMGTVVTKKKAKKFAKKLAKAKTV